jgi:hypothetical protein
VESDFIACRSCGLLSPADVCPDELDADSATSEREIFCREHAAHGVEVAIRCSTPAVYDGPIWDPMVTAWFEVRIGRDTCLVRSWRSSIEEPRRRELCRGVIERGRPRIEIDEDYLLLALDRWFFPHVLAPRRCAQFAETLRALVAGLDPDDLETSFDDADDPEIGIAPFPPSLIAALVEQTRLLFDPVEQDRLARFIETHRAEDGALALRVRRPLLVRAA